MSEQTSRNEGSCLDSHSSFEERNRKLQQTQGSISALNIEYEKLTNAEILLNELCLKLENDERVLREGLNRCKENEVEKIKRERDRLENDALQNLQNALMNDSEDSDSSSSSSEEDNEIMHMKEEDFGFNDRDVNS
ncbi:predicted protein [Chaetoceros tenuissimus]|uniref:Uncharacterized protein n=1 Tax=Chaetoceros tenuissimus TaxID=426638 RepID=A0AAD3CTQ8_9STRA|nr:predicted protein [Chaetoceros tenuissimus]